jgi:hypothetical protein
MKKKPVLSLVKKRGRPRKSTELVSPVKAPTKKKKEMTVNTEFRAWDPPTEVRERVKLMIAGGMSLDDIGLIIYPGGKVSSCSIKSKFREEVRTGKAEINSKVMGKLLDLALEGGRFAQTAMIFWLKANAGWTESSSPKPSDNKSNLSDSEIIVKKLQTAAKFMSETLPKANLKSGEESG